MWFLHTPGSVSLAGSLAQEGNDLCARASSPILLFFMLRGVAYMTVSLHSDAVLFAGAKVCSLESRFVHKVPKHSLKSRFFVLFSSMLEKE